MKKKSIIPQWFHLFLLLIGLGMAVAALFTPWANARVVMGIANKTIYPYQQEELHVVLLAPLFAIAGVLASLIYGFFSSRRFIPGLIILIMGTGTVILGIYLWIKIDANDVHFLGISPLKLAEVHPGIGILLLIMGGGILALYGLIYLGKSL